MSRGSGKAHWRHVKGVGMRCVRVLRNGKWRFTSNSACGKKKHAKRR